MQRSSAPRLAVLAYHKVGPYPGDWWSWYYVPEETFARQLELVRADGWEPIGLDALLAGLDRPDLLPERAALVTFDDGYRSLREGAARRLSEAGAPAVVFVATDYIGGTNEFDRDVEPEERICAWEDLDWLRDAGFSVQSHTASHPQLSSLSPELRDRELARSKLVIEDRLGGNVTALSYPYGDDGGDPAAMDDALVRLGYGVAFGYGGGPTAVPAPDRFRIPRIAMGPDTDLAAELAAPAG